MSGDRLRRLKELEKENERLRRAVSSRTKSLRRSNMSACPVMPFPCPRFPIRYAVCRRQKGPIPSSFSAFLWAIFSLTDRGRSAARSQSAPSLLLTNG